MKKTAVLAAVLAILAMNSANLHAQIIEIGFTAEVSEVDDRYDVLGGQISVGNIMTGYYTYDSATPDSAPPEEGGDYEYYSSPYGISVNVVDLVFQTDPDNVYFLIEVLNNVVSMDNYLLRSYNNLSLPNGIIVEHISWQLDDFTATALSSDALPTTPPVLADWSDNRGITIMGYGPRPGQPGLDAEFLIGAPVTSVYIIPEPATILLFSLGTALALRKHRRQK